MGVVIVAAPASADSINGIDDLATATTACAATLQSTSTTVQAIFVIHEENTSRSESQTDSLTFRNYLSQCGDGQNAVGLTHTSTANYVGLVDGQALSNKCLWLSQSPGNCGPFSYDNLDAQLTTATQGGRTAGTTSRCRAPAWPPTAARTWRTTMRWPT